jgi:hypothetical protein
MSVQVFSAAGVTVDWDVQHISDTVDPRTNSFITRENLDSVLVRPSCADAEITNSTV